ncbi:lipopolysaccharide biosynthesis protein [Sphingobacterium multivorum]|uniref:lipopolysaccharide biosynthesis protein n=1 Tax=Sphingobacterium multivorum TaxID=28454 RepID=UPI00289AF1CC|nr:oligosaccharide flippase family protein [Sphingobacterium multivorum]
MSSSKILRNTMFLYFRMLVTMLISFYSARVVLNVLGVVNYGLYNVVGGVVTMFSFLSSSLATASQRFFSFELGKNDFLNLRRTFSMTLSIYFILGIIIVILAETFGLWFLVEKMNVPSGRLSAAIWVYQFSILSFLIGMLITPYNAAIIAHENMKVYAYVSIIDAVVKLSIVYCLVYFSFDKLKLYSFLLFIATIITNSIYFYYARSRYNECKYVFFWEKKLFREIGSYSGWNLFGALAAVFNAEGINILLNIFFGPVVNAARGIAFQINTAVNQLVNNFLMASRPQIVKSFAQGEVKGMIQLVFQTSKFSFFLLSIIIIPLLLEIDFVLSIWLKEVPESTSLFARLILITALIDCLSYPLMTAAQATGRIKLYQIAVGSVMLLNLPISYIYLKMGSEPTAVFYIAICNSFLCLILRLFFLNAMVELPIFSFLKTVFQKCLICFGISFIVPYILFNHIAYDFLRFFSVLFLSIILLLLSIYCIGLTKNERMFIKTVVKNRLGY